MPRNLLSKEYFRSAGMPQSRGGSLVLALVRGDDEAEVGDSTYSGHLIGKARLEPQFL